MDHMQFAAFLERHQLTQVEFAAWLGTEKGTVWRWTLPPDDKNSRAVPLGIRAFCIAYDLMSPRLRDQLVKRLKSGGAGVRREKETGHE
ncbi:hypothetical protein TSO5_05995 [Azospirillum sp. TSO5]|nr:hypothetical protein TSO5_05995 [Azospirillum sp. TSO5]